MPVAGLVLTLAEGDVLRDTARDALAQEPRVTVGDLQPGGRLPVVTDTASLDDQRALWNELARIPGVLLVDLAFHDASDVEDFTSDALPSRWRRAEGSP